MYSNKLRPLTQTVAVNRPRLNALPIQDWHCSRCKAMLKGRMVSSSEESEESTESGSSDESSSSSDEETEQRAAAPSSTRISFKKSQLRLGPLGKAKQEAKAAASQELNAKLKLQGSGKLPRYIIAIWVALFSRS